MHLWLPCEGGDSVLHYVATHPLAMSNSDKGRTQSLAYVRSSTKVLILKVFKGLDFVNLRIPPTPSLKSGTFFAPPSPQVRKKQLSILPLIKSALIYKKQSGTSSLTFQEMRTPQTHSPTPPSSVSFRFL